jgi:hypothetical protein
MLSRVFLNILEHCKRKQEEEGHDFAALRDVKHHFNISFNKRYPRDLVSLGGGWFKRVGIDLLRVQASRTVLLLFSELIQGAKKFS